MTENPRRPRRSIARIAVLAALAVLWIAALMWLWPSETTGSCFAYAPLKDGTDSCQEAIRAEERFRAWFIPVLAAGPALAVVAWFTLRSKDRR